MRFKDIAIFSAEVDVFRIHFWDMSKHEAINLLTNDDSTKKKQDIIKL